MYVTGKEMQTLVKSIYGGKDIEIFNMCILYLIGYHSIRGDTVFCEEWRLTKSDLMPRWSEKIPTIKRRDDFYYKFILNGSYDLIIDDLMRISTEGLREEVKEKVYEVTSRIDFRKFKALNYKEVMNYGLIIYRGEST